MTAARRALLGAAGLGVVHALVDASSSALLVWRSAGGATFAAGDSASVLTADSLWTCYLLYNVLAFATQFPIGAIADRWSAYRATLLIGVASVLSAVAVPALPPLVAIIVASLGNSAFHVGAGAIVLNDRSKRAAASGLLVGPGSIGLAVGLAFGRWLPLWRVWLVVMLTVAVLAVFLRVPEFRRAHAGSTSGFVADKPSHTALCPARSKSLAVGCLAAMMVVILLRSTVSQLLGLPFRDQPTMLWQLAIAACAGNVLGGILADCLGWWIASGGGLFLAMLTLGLPDSHAWAVVAGMVFVQATMPVTLLAMDRILDGEPGFVFGLSALAIFLGVVPLYFSANASLFASSLPAWLALASLIALSAGLFRIRSARNET